MDGREAVKQIALHPNYELELMMSCSHDCTVRVFHLGTMSEVWRLDLDDPVGGISVTHDNSVAIFSGQSVSIWNFNPVAELFANIDGTQRLRLRHPLPLPTPPALATDDTESAPETIEAVPGAAAGGALRSQCVAVIGPHNARLLTSEGNNVCTVIPHSLSDGMWQNHFRCLPY